MLPEIRSQDRLYDLPKFKLTGYNGFRGGDRYPPKDADINKFFSYTILTGS
jgi:hypothetical protein